MTDPQKIPVKEFDYHLPEQKIARYPATNRDASKLLIYEKGNITSDTFNNIGHHLSRDYLLVFNNAKVVYARLFFRKSTGALIEIFCLEPADPPDYASAFKQNRVVRWKCMVGNLKKWKSGRLQQDIEVNNKISQLQARLVERQQNQVIVEFTWNQPSITFGDILDHAGKVPIPPYLKRESENIDKERYQTVYSRIKGSVAAPTAGLHFSDKVIGELDQKGISRAELTLHVGAGTFRPIKTETTEEHPMHVEHFSISGETIERFIHQHDQILAVGTTSVRTLESIYWLGVKLEKEPFQSDNIMLDQWEHLELPGNISARKALENIRQHLEVSGQSHLNASTQIMITPGYRFKLTHGLITNFHLPRSSLLMLIAAFVGDDWKRIYDYALQNDFRFLSYGDSSLLLP